MKLDKKDNKDEWWEKIEDLVRRERSVVPSSSLTSKIEGRIFEKQKNRKMPVFHLVERVAAGLLMLLAAALGFLTVKEKPIVGGQQVEDVVYFDDLTIENIERIILK